VNNTGAWFKSGAVIFSRIKNHNSGQEIYGFAIATASTDTKAREIPEGVTILIKHLDNSITELYTESGNYSQKESSSTVAVEGDMLRLRLQLARMFTLIAVKSRKIKLEELLSGVSQK
jgi:hypothetical protein